mmetsp:Transcript_40680/g.102397  ORF Transcript_40680/g.102397 Transcript_40680/m.102397 type:complete len:117 (-) Transcript_40680:606-956(-)
MISPVPGASKPTHSQTECLRASNVCTHPTMCTSYCVRACVRRVQLIYLFAHQTAGQSIGIFQVPASTSKLMHSRACCQPPRNVCALPFLPTSRCVRACVRAHLTHHLLASAAPSLN